MSRVLITTAPYGAGHHQVARAVADAVCREGGTPEVVDHFAELVSPAFAAASAGLFWATLRWAPRLWGLAYRCSGRLARRSALMAGMDRLGAGALLRRLEASRPRAVIHVHPTPAGAMAWLRDRGLTGVPHGVVLTEFGAHPQWIYPGLDRYFVAADWVRAEAVACGAAADRVVVTGLPVHAGFDRAVDRDALKAALGLDGRAPAVLLTAGMRGTLGGLATVCRVLADLPLAFAALVVCGEHARLAGRLRSRHGSDGRFRIFGQRADMAALMGAADLVVGKAGGATCAEALALGRPLVLFGSLPGQERANEAALVGAGAAVCAHDGRALARVLAGLLLDPARRAALGRAAGRLGRPEAARRVAKEMLTLDGVPGV